MGVETKVMLLDGTYHVIKGHPTDYVQVINGTGVSKDKTVRTKNGRRIKLSNVVTMQFNR